MDKPIVIKQILGSNLKYQRKLIGYTQEKLAETSDLSVQTINDIEGGRRWVSDKTLAKLAEVFDLEPYQLLIPYRFDNEKSANKNISLKGLFELQQLIKNSLNQQIDKHFGDFQKEGNLLPHHHKTKEKKM